MFVCIKIEIATVHHSVNDTILLLESSGLAMYGNWGVGVRSPMA